MMATQWALNSWICAVEQVRRPGRPPPLDTLIMKAIMLIAESPDPGGSTGAWPQLLRHCLPLPSTFSNQVAI